VQQSLSSATQNYNSCTHQFPEKNATVRTKGPSAIFPVNLGVLTVPVIIRSDGLQTDYKRADDIPDAQPEHITH